MNDAVYAYRKTFSSLMEVDKSLWSIVLEIQKNDDTLLNELVKPIMQLRGQIHTDCLRPIYKKYPELAEEAGFGAEKS